MIALFTLMIAGLAWFLQSIAATFARPAVNTASQDSGSNGSTRPIDTGKTIAVVVAERGPLTPYNCQSFQDYKNTFGVRNSNTARYWDAVEAFYKYGGGELTIIRARAAGAIAHVDIPDAGAGISLTATAVGQGVFYNSLNVVIETDPNDAGGRRVRVTHDTDTSISEVSPYFDDQVSLVDWSAASRYIRLALGATALMPANGTLSLAAGTDDYTTITRVERAEALTAITPRMEPAQVAIPGASTAAEWNDLLTFVDGRRLKAILAYPDTADEATLTTLANGARAFGRNGAGFANWLREPGPAGQPKSVEPSLPVCAKIAVWDARSNGLGQNKPVAGTRRGVFRRCLGLTQTFDDPDLVTRLTLAGVNLIQNVPGAGVTIWGWRSLADPNSDGGWVNFGHARLQMALESKIDAALTPYLFEEIDGEGTLLAEIKGTVEGQILKPYFDAGSLYGATLQDAALVDMSANDATTAQNRQVIVNTTVVESEFAEEIDVNLTKNLITQGVGS